MKNLTPAQKRYLIQAYQIQMGIKYGIYFSIWVPGRTGTGRALLGKGLISTVDRENGWPLNLSLEGYRVAKELVQDQVKA